ncbi:MAG TPA: serine hydrolase [Pyrinomonadaceae bacterium]|nr:serine hydrolase [Pyrinomonadaceae bacterium]
MRAALILAITCASLSLFIAPRPQIANAQATSAKELAGLWEAKKRFGPEVRGTLFVRQTGATWQAEIAGRFALVKLEADSVSFELPDGQGKFRGRFDARRTKIVGHWTQPQGVEISPLASPVTLIKHGAEWRGDVAPLDDALTFYLMIKQRADGSMGAFLRNPERHLGWFRYRVDRIERDGKSIKLFTANQGAEKGRMIAEGTYNADAGLLSIYLERGRTYEFRRVTSGRTSNFYPRGRPDAGYRYAPPPLLDDGWQTGTLEEVGISHAAIEKFVQMVIDTPMDAANSKEDHGILIARYGKLVLEEYFHGEHREKPHDTRSASKSVASDMTGAAIYSGIPIKTSDLVYQVMNAGTFPPGLDARKRALKLEHLLTMSSGFECDDWDTPERSPGYEDNFWDQSKEPDYYKWTMALKIVHEPGTKAFYCSAGANLVGGVVARAARQSAQELFHRLLAEPLGIKRYYVMVSPAGDLSLTGGARFPPRDFMKLGQVHLNGGTWKGRKIFTPDWSRRATATSVTEIGGRKRQYGYLWWINEYPYKGRTVRAYYAAGNGGQIVMGIPDLDLVIAFYGGNYNDPSAFISQNVYVPEHILPAVN